jgi:hypothetical protein
MFIEEKDLGITDVLWNYFDSVRSRWPKAWEYQGRGLMLNKTNGFRALMRFLRPAYLHLTKPGGIPSSEDFLKVFQRSSLKDDDFNTDLFKPGSSGEGALSHAFKESTGL